MAYLEAVGVQDLQTRAPMTERSLFRIYSMTKAVTAVAVMMLHEEGRFALTDPVVEVPPGVRRRAGADRRPTARRAPAAAPITVEDLLLHTSGSAIARRSSIGPRVSDRGSMTLPQFTDEASSRAPLMEDPARATATARATTVLGRLVEVWSGKPFDVFLQERVFTPLKMTETGFWVEPVTPSAARDRVRAGQDRSGRRAHRRSRSRRCRSPSVPALIEGAVGLVSTVPDYLRFAQMLLNKGELDGVRLLRAEHGRDA